MVDTVMSGYDATVGSAPERGLTGAGPAPVQRLRVCALMQSFYPHIGGAETNLQALIPKLRQRGVDIAVLTRRRPGWSRRARVNGAPVVRVPVVGPRIVASLGYTAASLMLMGRMRRTLDVIHANELLSPTTTALLARLIFRRPIVTTVLRGGALGDVAVLRAGRFGSLRLRLFVRWVDAFVAVSQEIVDELESAGVPRHRIARIPYGVDLERFRPVDASRRAAIRQELGWGDGPVAAFVGRLEPEKGLKTLLDAWPAVREALPKATLAIAGEGVQRDELERRGVAGVSFLGPIREPAPLMQAADCFVLPSYTEGLPNALLEALASGLPCVATTIGGSSEAVRDGVEGYLVPPGEPGPLARALVEALSGDAHQRLGDAARARAAALYSLESNADRLVEVYRRLVPGSTRTTGR
jgi:glycosyltransferase involved in cell wall biosynthesis